VEEYNKEDKPIDIYIYSISAMDIVLSPKDINTTRHIHGRFHLVKAGVLIIGLVG
jgi:hypothetical protein